MVYLELVMFSTLVPEESVFNYMSSPVYNSKDIQCV